MVDSTLFQVPDAKEPVKTVHWPVVGIPLPDGPGEVILIGRVGLLPVKGGGSNDILLVMDRFSR